MAELMEDEVVSFCEYISSKTDGDYLTFSGAFLSRIADTLAARDKEITALENDRDKLKNQIMKDMERIEGMEKDYVEICEKKNNAYKRIEGMEKQERKDVRRVVKLEGLLRRVQKEIKNFKSYDNFTTLSTEIDEALK